MPFQSNTLTGGGFKGDDSSGPAHAHRCQQSIEAMVGTDVQYRHSRLQELLDESRFGVFKTAGKQIPVQRAAF